jgi:hypothetical protein
MKLKIGSCNRCGHVPDWKWGTDVKFKQSYMVFRCPKCESVFGGAIYVSKILPEKARS